MESRLQAQPLFLKTVEANNFRAVADDLGQILKENYFARGTRKIPLSDVKEYVVCSRECEVGDARPVATRETAGKQ
jgi:hypothetical protein